MGELKTMEAAAAPSIPGELPARLLDLQLSTSKAFWHRPVDFACHGQQSGVGAQPVPQLRLHVLQHWPDAAPGLEHCRDVFGLGHAIPQSLQMLQGSCGGGGQEQRAGTEQRSGTAQSRSGGQTGFGTGWLYEQGPLVDCSGEGKLYRNCQEIYFSINAINYFQVN